MSVDYLPLTSTSTQLLDAVRVYNEYIDGDLPRQEQFFRSHMRRPGYVGVMAISDDKVVGFVFGSTSLVGQWWHERVAANVGSEHPALQNAWVLTQLNVLQAYRNKGIGQTLHDRILAQQTSPRVLLSTQVANTGAQRFYKRNDWYILHDGFRFSANDEPYKILAKKLTDND
ncbi:MAG: GNAT family N-acetyltransferase [Chloroflexota bacterium]